MSSEKKKSSKTTNSTSPPYEIPVHNLFAKETKLFLFSKLPTLDQIFNKYVNLFHLEEEEDLDLDDLILDIKYFYKNLWFTIDTEKDVQTFLHLQKQYCTTNPKEEIEINSENNLPCLCLVINHYILNNEEEEEEDQVQEEQEVPVRREETKKEQKGSKKNNLESCRHSLVNILKELNYNFPIPTISSKGFSIPSLLGAEFIEQIENAKGKIMELEQVYSTLHSRLKRRGRRHKGELKLEMDRLLMCGWIWNSIKTLLINQNNLLPIKEQKLPQILYYEYLKEQIVLLKKPEEKSKDKPKSSSSENMIQIQKQQLLSQEQKYKEIYSLLSERDEEERLLLLFIKYPFLYEIIGMEQEELVFNRSWFLKYLKGNILSKVCEDISFLQPQEEDNNKEEQEVELSPFPQRDSSLQEIILLPPQVEEEEEEEEKSPVPKKKKKKDRRKSQSNSSSNKKKKNKK